jgi:Core-2/I-Branching enzyme
MQASWGLHSLVEAERVLLRAALEDPQNRRFQMLCEQTVPLYPPEVLYRELMAAPGSHVAACDAGGQNKGVRHSHLGPLLHCASGAVRGALTCVGGGGNVSNVSTSIGRG